MSLWFQDVPIHLLQHILKHITSAVSVHLGLQLNSHILARQ